MMWLIQLHIRKWIRFVLQLVLIKDDATRQVLRSCCQPNATRDTLDIDYLVYLVNLLDRYYTQIWLHTLFKLSDSVNPIYSRTTTTHKPHTVLHKVPHTLHNTSLHFTFTSRLHITTLPTSPSPHDYSVDNTVLHYTTHTQHITHSTTHSTTHTTYSTTLLTRHAQHSSTTKSWFF